MPSVATSRPPEYAYQPPSGGLFAKPCSVRKRSISSSGLTPGSRRRNTFRIASSSSTTDVFDCSAPTQRTSAGSRETGTCDGVELDGSVGAPQRRSRAQGAHELSRECDVVVDLELVAAQRVEQLVEVVRAGLVAHLDESERKLRLADVHDNGVEHLCVCDAARLRAVPALPHHVFDEGALVEAHGADRLSWNQKNPRGASVSR